MRSFAILASLMLPGCLITTLQEPITRMAPGDAATLASCTYREMRNARPGTPLRLTPLEDIRGAEVVFSMPACGIVGCVGDYLQFGATFQPGTAGETQITVRTGTPTAYTPTEYWQDRINPAVQMCSARHQANAAAARAVR